MIKNDILKQYRECNHKETEIRHKDKNGDWLKCTLCDKVFQQRHLSFLMGEDQNDNYR